MSGLNNSKKITFVSQTEMAEILGPIDPGIDMSKAFELDGISWQPALASTLDQGFEVIGYVTYDDAARDPYPEFHIVDTKLNRFVKSIDPDTGEQVMRGVVTWLTSQGSIDDTFSYEEIEIIQRSICERMPVSYDPSTMTTRQAFGQTHYRVQIATDDPLKDTNPWCTIKHERKGYYRKDAAGYTFFPVAAGLFRLEDAEAKIRGLEDAGQITIQPITGPMGNPRGALGNL